MGGFVNVVRRMAMACLAGGLVFGIPNAALARDPPLQTARLPWQIGPAFASTTPFDDGFTRVVFETKQMIRAFADSSWYSAPPAPIPGRFGEVSSSLWTLDAHVYRQSNPEQPTLDVGAFRATLKPVEVSSTVVAESRNIQGVLVGVHIEVLD